MRRVVVAAVLLLAAVAATAACRGDGKGPLGLLRERPPPPTQAPGAKGISFFYADISAGKVWVAGEFNGWASREGDRKLLAMAKRSDGLWTATVPYRQFVRDPEFDRLDDEVYVESGRRYPYKFVIDTSRWIADPSNPSTVDDGFGGKNSLLVVP
jgi:hypothetical protein